MYASEASYVCYTIRNPSPCEASGGIFKTTVMLKLLKLRMKLVPRWFFLILGRGVGNEILDCSHGSAFLPSPYDCHSFYRCFAPNAVPVKMSCGFLMYNPILNHCDWPSNTIRVREECGTSNGYFGNNSEAGAETREVEATTAKPKEVATTPKEPRIIAEPDFVAGAPVVFYVNKNKENKPPRLSQG